MLSFFIYNQIIESKFWHLFFSKIRDQVKFIEELDQNGSLKRNLNNPSYKDTVQVPYEGYTIIRFMANNPGSWLLNSEIDQSFGMSIVFKVGNELQIKKKPKYWPRCGDFTTEDL